jgi:hypothetical protein
MTTISRTPAATQSGYTQPGSGTMSVGDMRAEAHVAIDEERGRLKEYGHDGRHTGWKVTGEVIGGLMGAAMPVTAGIMMFRSRSGLTALGGSVIGLFGGLMGAALGAQLGGGMLHGLDRKLDPSARDALSQQDAATKAKYGQALDKADAAIDAASSEGGILDVGQELRVARPTDLQYPAKLMTTTPGDGPAAPDGYQLLGFDSAEEGVS